MRIISKTTILMVCLLSLFSVSACAQFFVFENPLVGEEAPDFTTRTLNSGTLSMGEYRNGEAAIVFFWATWCPHCRTQLGELNKKKDELKEKGIKLVLVDLQESAQQVESYMKKNDIDFEVFLDKDQSVAESYAIVGVPTFFFLDKDGIIKAVEHEIPSDYEEILLAG